jgi:glycosyltransferase involved in cell wall biosynthesis
VTSRVGDKSDKGHVLVVAWAFAPAAPIGTMRPLRLVRRLAAEGWGVSVLMATPSTYGPDVPIDFTLLDKVPSTVKVLHAPILRLPSLPRRRVVADDKSAMSGTVMGQTAGRRSRPPEADGLLRRTYNAFDELTSIPDNKAGWIVPAFSRGFIEVLRRRPTAIYSTAPPWSGQLVALGLAKATGLPWVADFRDPWARAPWRETQPVRIRKASVTMERSVIHRADAVLFATRTNRDEYINHYGHGFSAKFRVVPNGCDVDDFAAARSTPRSSTFVLLHAGSLYGQRSPVPIFRAIASAIAKGLIDRNSFRLRLIGAVSAGSEFERAAQELGLQGVVEFVDRMPRREIIEEMARASCLLVLQPGTTVSIPGKLYEYFAVGRPVLALTEEGELADLVRESGAGVAVNPFDEDAIERALQQMLRAGTAADAFRTAPAQFFDGERSAAEAVQIIEQVVDRGKRMTQVAVSRES